MTQGCEELATHFRMNSARPLGRRTIWRNGTSAAWRINSETWETLNLDGTKTHFEFELTRKM